MTKGRGDPIISGPEPSGWSAPWAQLKAVWAAIRTRLARRDPPPPKRRSAPRDAEAAQPHTSTGADLMAWRRVHGPPAVWMAPFFLVFAILHGLPHLAEVIQPQAPRSLITAIVAALPDQAGRLSAMMSGWLWSPWWLAVLALLLRLRAAWTAGRAILDAVGWGMAALVVEGAAWLYFGRKVLEAGFSPAEQTGAWHLLLAEFVFLFLTAVLFGPSTRQRIRFEQ